VLAHVDSAFDPGAEATMGQTSAVLIVQGGALIFARYADGVDPAATFPSWSMCKSILAAAVGLLARDGRIHLDDRVDWPGWRTPGDARAELTVRDLLRMKASLAWAEEYSADVPSDVVEMLFGAGAADTAAYVAAKALVGPPGTVYEYSSGTSNLLAWAFGRAFDHDPAAQEAYLRRELFDPIGMTTALPKFDPTGTWIGSTYCFATAEDFARFGLLLLRGGRWDGGALLPAPFVEELRTPQPDVDDEGWGYGLHVWTRPEAGGFFACRGYQAQYVFVAPAHDTVVVRLGITAEDRKKAAAAWTIALLELACQPPV
jgi:CubicO group peptidase (beta-lactamase class C family)